MASRATTLTTRPAGEGGSGESGPAALLAETLREIRRREEVREDWPADVLAEAERAAAAIDLPDVDLRDVPFLTIDPPGARDLDQALHLQADGEGFRVRYVIADLPVVVAPGGGVDTEARLRGQTLYAPDVRVPLHPPVLSEDAASLLPGADRSAYVWDLRLDATGALRDIGLRRAVVRSRAQLTYEEAQAAIDAGTADPSLLALAQVGPLRQALELERGGASLPMPEQQVEPDPDRPGSFRVRLRPMLPVEGWNAQISLLTGMAAADLMLRGRVGILRTMPPADERDVQRFRRQALALGVPWADGVTYGEFLQGLDGDDPVHLAVIHAATALFRGAAYTAFDGEPPEQPVQAAIAAPYTHATAPLRRLVDRFVLAVCAALAADEPVPAWAREALPDLPELMATSDRRTRTVDRESLDAVEAASLADRVGEVFEASVVDVREDEDDPEVEVQVLEPVVLHVARGRAGLGERVRVRLVEVDVAAGRIELEVVDEGDAPTST